jgi:Cdc6-like AAA superfamily ATPase
MANLKDWFRRGRPPGSMADRNARLAGELGADGAGASAAVSSVPRPSANGHGPANGHDAAAEPRAARAAMSHPAPGAAPVSLPFLIRRTGTEASPPPRPAPTGVQTGAEDAAFLMEAPGVGWRRRTTAPEAAPSNAVLREAFTPTRPKQDSALFSGRYRQMERIIAAIEEERAHVMLYGERGSGKTSLSNVLATKAEQAGYLVLRQACSSETTFQDLFRAFLRRMPATLVADGLGYLGRQGRASAVGDLESIVPERFGVVELVAAFERIRERHIVLIVDEYDRVTDEDVKARFAELLKNMADGGVPVTLLIIGVAENVGQLLGKHPSLQRAVVTVPMPLMTRRELDGILAVGEKKSGLRFDPAVRSAIVDFAQGLPYHAQLLGLFTARSAIRRGSSEIGREDLKAAVRRSAEEAEARIKEAYDLAVAAGSHQAASFRDVLFHAARCRTDEFGTFTVADVAAAAAPAGGGPETSVLQIQYPLKKLTEADRGAMLRRLSGLGGLRYQFVSQMMRHHVLVRQAEERGLI